MWRYRRVSPKRRYEQRAEPMLIDAVGLTYARLERRESRRKKARQPEQPFGAAIDVGAGFEAAGHQSIERRDGLVAAAQLVVERKDADDETGTKPERRRRALGDDVERRPSENHLALEIGQPSRAAVRMLMERVVQLCSCNQVWQDDRRRVLR